MKSITEYIRESLFDKDLIEKEHIKLDPTDLKKRDEVILYAQILCARNGWKFEEVKSGWGEKNAYAFEIKYNQHLSLVIDFINRMEFIYKWLEDGDIFYEIDSTYEIYNIDNWDEMLDPKQYIRAKSRVLSTPKKREKLPRLLRCVNKLKELV